jgi:hypothetical protein
MKNQAKAFIAFKAHFVVYAVAIAAIFASIALARLLFSSAATGNFHGEAEASTMAGPHIVHIGDASVSGNGFVTLSSGGGSVTPTPQPGSCGSGGVCVLSDITPHATVTDCRSAINMDGSMKAYAIPESWLTIHRDNFKTISTKLCGKVFTNNLHTAVGEHQNGDSYDGKQMAEWMSNFYIGTYQ